jgi:hypothetical protein
MTIAFRFLHIVCGVLWVGAVIFVAGFLMPSLRASGPAAGAVMGQLTQVRKMPIYMMAMAMLTIISGVALLMISSAGAPGLWMKSGPGMTYGAGGAMAILAAIIGMVVTSPAAKRAGMLAAAAGQRGGPPTPEQAAEIQRLQNRLAASTKVVAVLVLLATTAMAVARYVP